LRKLTVLGYAVAMTMPRNARIYVAGHRGLVGSAILRKLTALGFTHLITRSRAELDLLDGSAVREFYRREKPEFVFVAAARVGGILANSQQPVPFLYENLLLQNNLIHGAHEAEVRKLLFLGSSCIYPKLAPQPIREDYLLTGPLEPTNEWYAIAKIAGIKLCQALRQQFNRDFISVMPTNLYGPHDNYDLQTSHVLPALIRKFHDAKISRASSVNCWGTGSPLREFLHVDDLAEACCFLMENYNDARIINAGSGQEISIHDLAELVKQIVGYSGQIFWDHSKPDGTPRKLMDSSRLFALGWKPKIDLETGIRREYENFSRQPV
jgi:GDP-L-fucose synthase